MAKITRRQYEERKAELEAQLADAKRRQDQCGIAAEYGVTPELVEEWDAAHDDEWAANEQLRMLEHEWNTRHWTAAEWNS